MNDCTCVRGDDGQVRVPRSRCPQHGWVDIPTPAPALTDEQIGTRIVAAVESSYVVTNSGCWEWARSVGAQGYGFLWYGNGRYIRAHIAAYEHFVGPIPDGLVLDHLCRNRRCINPAHLEPVTNRENVLRGNGVTAENARKTHCEYGHEFSQENTGIRARTGWRTCRECKRAMNRNAKALARRACPICGAVRSQVKRHLMTVHGMPERDADNAWTKVKEATNA